LVKHAKTLVPSGRLSFPFWIYHDSKTGKIRAESCSEKVTVLEELDYFAYPEQQTTRYVSYTVP
jgi:hypothetical protein